MNKVAFLTTIFPMNQKYLFNFFDSLNSQTYKNFDIIIINDNYLFLDTIKSKYINLNIIELKCSKGIAKNREFGINYIIDNKYDILIFGDSDDYFDNNRVEKSIELLKNCQIVVNDFTSFSKQNFIIKNYMSNRIDNNQKIDSHFIEDKNIFGMSNTALNISAIDKVLFPGNLDVVDWYFFSCLLLEKIDAIFTNQTTTYYRQHTNNIVGINKISIDSIKQSLLVKEKMYLLLKNRYKQFDLLHKNVLESLQLITFQDPNKINIINYPLWWEETKLVQGNS